MQLLAVAIMKPRHLELRTLETHGPIEIHEAQSGAHVEDIREGFISKGKSYISPIEQVETA